MKPDVESFTFARAGEIPNSPLPLLFYRQALPPELRLASGCQALFARNGWSGNWVNGIFDYWHFHVTGHEVLGCVDGHALIGFGGDSGISVEFSAGDVVVIPAGVGHKRLSDKHAGFTVVGGYPPGQNGAIVRPGDMPLADAEQALAELAPPLSDPVSGNEGPIFAAWAIEEDRGPPTRTGH